MEVIKAKVTPARKRVLHAEQFLGALNWAKYFEQYQLNMSGLVPNSKGGESHVCHCWRFVQRGDT